MAEEFLQDAKTNLENKSLRTSVSHSYYSVYHACIALFEHYGYKAHNFLSRSGRPAKKWEHGIIAKKSYNELVVRHKVLDAQDVWSINWLYRERINADYRYDISITEKMAKESLKKACAVNQNIKEAMK
ncbi:HEPN domain-containing protein [bacterium]|nr:HEPN domain-containing protein [bacterium]